MVPVRTSTVWFGGVGWRRYGPIRGGPRVWLLTPMRARHDYLSGRLR